MDHLPQEVLDGIAAQLLPGLAKREAHRLWLLPNPDGAYKHSAAPYATISAAWQRAIESLTFQCLTLITAEDISTAERYLRRNEHRRKFVLQIRIDIRIDRAAMADWEERWEQWASYLPYTLSVRSQMYAWRDHHLVDQFHRMIGFINRVWVSFIIPSPPCHDVVSASTLRAS